MADSNSILGRVNNLLRANINAAIDKAEDPQKMIDQIIRDFTGQIAEAETSVAQTIGQLRLAQEDLLTAQGDQADWGAKASAASKKADQLRAAGNTADADKFDALAKLALTRQITAETRAKDLETSIASQSTEVDQLKAGLDQMHIKLEDLKDKRNDLVARGQMAHAQVGVQKALKAVQTGDPTSAMGHFEDKIRQEEAQAQGMAELASSSVESQFASLADDETATEVDARLAALKAK